MIIYFFYYKSLNIQWVDASFQISFVYVFIIILEHSIIFTII